MMNIKKNNPKKFVDNTLESLEVRPVPRYQRDAWDGLMSGHHYLGGRLVGESVRYAATLGGQWVALLGWSSAAFKCRPRDEWIGWDQERRWQNLKYIANNARFLVLPGVRIKNLASKALALNLKRLSGDWENSYGHPVFLAETFVDHHRFAGTCYKASNWIELGTTRGFGRDAGRYYSHGSSKTIFAYPLHPGARRALSALFYAPPLAPGYLVDVSHIRPDGLLKTLRDLPDPRERRGRRYSYASVLATVTYAWLSGAHSYYHIGKWSLGLNQAQLRLLGCPLHEEKRCYTAPGESILRRAMVKADPEALNARVKKWLLSHGLDLPQAVPPWDHQVFARRGKR